MRTFTLSVLLFSLTTLSAQITEREGVFGEDWGGYLWGIQGGLSLANQDWAGLETELRRGYHGGLFYESIPVSGRFSWYGQLGYHQRGSRIARRLGFDPFGQGFTLPADEFVFHNVSLGVGAKSVVSYTRTADLYYKLGVRLEYSFANNLSDYDNVDLVFRQNYPFDQPDFINEVVYGATFGAGAVRPISDDIGVFIELSLHPDLNFQYVQPRIDNVIDPFTSAPRSIGERMIRNVTIEITAGFRFLRSWTYVD